MTAAAAAVVVLPTPPGPQAMTISLVASSPSIELPPGAAWSVGALPSSSSRPTWRPLGRSGHQ